MTHRGMGRGIAPKFLGLACCPLLAGGWIQLVEMHPILKDLDNLVDGRVTVTNNGLGRESHPAGAKVRVNNKHKQHAKKRKWLLLFNREPRNAQATHCSNSRVTGVRPDIVANKGENKAGTRLPDPPLRV